MRVIAEIPHPVMKISIFAWNEKYHLKFEAGPFEQTYKIGQMDLSGVEELKSMVDEAFCDEVLHRFKAMREDFGAAWKKSQNTPR